MPQQRGVVIEVIRELAEHLPRVPPIAHPLEVATPDTVAADSTAPLRILIIDDDAVILLTGWGRRLDGDGQAPADIDHILGKPPKVRELRAALAKYR